MPTRIKPPDVQGAIAVIEAARARGRGRHSPLYLWFADHHTELAAAFERNSPAWADLATYLGEGGLRDADGKIPTARATRDAWYRVGKDKAAAAAKPVPKPPVSIIPITAKPSAPSETRAVDPPSAKTADVNGILDRLGGSRSKGSRLPNSVE